MAIIVLSYIQENELIKYYVSDEILTIEITKKQSVNDKDSRLGQSFGEDQSMRMKQNIIKILFHLDVSQVTEVEGKNETESPAYKLQRDLCRTEISENSTISAGGKNTNIKTELFEVRMSYRCEVSYSFRGFNVENI